MSLDLKLSGKKLGIALLLGAAFLSGCAGSTKNRIIERERQSGIQVIDLANEYCNAQNKLPNQDFGYYKAFVDREEHTNGEQQRFVVGALQYDGMDYSCKGSWQDIPYSP